MTEEASDPSRAPVALTREVLRDGWVQQMVAGGGYRVLSDAELKASLDTALAAHPADRDVWLFAYGSLIWNPAFHFVEHRIATVHGLHRRFCLWTHLGRGSPDQPGLVLGLDRGGQCRGVAYRIAASEVEAELDLVWRREMVTASYRPRWVRAASGAGPMRVLTFVINRAHERYARGLGEEELIRTLATARGALGSCAEYLSSTASHLKELGIADAGLERLTSLVEARRRLEGASAPAG